MFTKGLKTCYHRLILFSLLSFILIPNSFARNDSIYGGTIIKLDIVSPIVVAGTNGWKIQNYEIAANVRLINRLYPTLELGYAGGDKTVGDTLHYHGHGGFFRVGMDINPLKKHPESPHALLIGVRLGTAVQQMNQYNDHIAASGASGVKADCWGEIVAGCQVQIVKGLYMGWMGRFKCLFTRKSPADSEEALQVPVYIPGFGSRDNIGWGLSYHIGYKF